MDSPPDIMRMDYSLCGANTLAVAKAQQIFSIFESEG